MCGSERRGGVVSGSPHPRPEKLERKIPIVHVELSKKPSDPLTNPLDSRPLKFGGNALVIITFIYRGWKNKSSNSK